jgi:hypothetical protein
MEIKGRLFDIFSLPCTKLFCILSFRYIFVAAFWRRPFSNGINSGCRWGLKNGNGISQQM